MTPQALKASILQLAIQGKLVPQRPEEGTAEELYQQIQAEKQALIANGTIKREKALPPIKEDEIPFDIPETWKWVRLGEILDVRDGTHDTPKYISSGIPLVTSKNLKSGSIDFSGVKFISPEDHISISKRSKVEKNDILFAMIGSIGNAIICKETPYFSIKNMALFKNIAYTLSMEYVLYFLIFSEGKMKQESSGGVQSFVSLGYLRAYKIPLPPLEEQKRIVAKIEEMLPLIDRYGEAYTELETFNKRFPDDLRKSILQEAIQGKLVPQLPEEGTAEDLYQQIQAEKQRLIAAGTIKKEKPLPPIEEKDLPFDIPETWKWVRLGELFSFINGDRGKNYPAKSTLHKEGIPFISAINMCDKSISPDGLLCVSPEQFANLRSGHLKKGDLVICIRGSLGKFCIYPYEQGAIASSLVILRQIWPCTQNFIAAYLDSFFFLEEIEKSQNGTAQPNLSAKGLANFFVPLPPLAEQKRIVSKIEKMLNLCQALG